MYSSGGLRLNRLPKPAESGFGPVDDRHRLPEYIYPYLNNIFKARKHAANLKMYRLRK